MKSFHYAPLAIAVLACCQGSLFAATIPEKQTITVISTPGNYAPANLDNSAKFAEPVFKTPRSITVIPQQLLQDTNATSLVQALEYVPGMSFKSGDALARPGGDHPTFRGFDGTDALLVDGVRSTASQSRESFAIETVEVIKGSSAVYNGRGNAGGSINIITKKPFLGESLTTISGGLGTDNYRRTTLDTNQVINDHIAGRFNALWHQNDKPKRSAVDYKRWGVAPSVLFSFNDNTSLMLSYYHFQTHDIPDYSIPFVQGRPLKNSRREFYGLVNRDYIEYQTDTPEMIFSHDFSDGSSMKNSMQYSQTHQRFIATSPKFKAFNGTPGLFLAAKTGDFRTKTFSDLLDYQKQFDFGLTSHKLSAGLEYTWEKNERRSIMVRDVNGYNIREYPEAENAKAMLNNGLMFPYTSTSCQDQANAFTCARVGKWNAFNPWTGSVSWQQESKYPPTSTVNNTVSGYLFDSMTIADTVIVSAGVRLDHYNTSITIQNIENTNLKRTDNLFNWQAGLLYNPIDTLSVYASYSTSSSPANPDAIQGGIPDPKTNDFKPEEYQSAELGVKWSPVKDQLLLSAAIFDTTKHNGYINISNELSSPGKRTDKVPAGKQRVRGIELSIGGNITKNLSLFAGYAFLDSKDLDGSAKENNKTHIVTNSSKGKRLPLTPEQSASLWTKYKFTPDFSMGAGLAYTGKVYTEASNMNIAPAYTTVNLMAKYRATKQFSVQVNVNNLFDRKYFDNLYGGFATYAAGRQITATVNYRF